MTTTDRSQPDNHVSEALQARVKSWMMACFGAEIAADKLERNDRFIEEALELVQASGYTKDRAHALVDYVFDRPQGQINQEVGGVMITLAAHCLAHGVNMHEAGETELARIWTKVEQIRAKQAAKPTGSALPIAMNTRSQAAPTSEGVSEALTHLESEARRFAAFYPQDSDGRNTFVIFADNIAAMSARSPVGWEDEVRSKLDWIREQAAGIAATTAGCASSEGDPHGVLQMVNSQASDIAINANIAADLLQKMAGVEG